MSKKENPSEQAESDLLDHLVTKSNGLVRASYRLLLQEQRLVLAAISKLDSRKSRHTHRNNNTKIRITAMEFAETFGIDSRKAYEELREAANNLYDRDIKEINGKRTNRQRWVSRATYHDGEGWAELTFAEDIIPHLTLLREKFTRYRLRQVAGLRSVYSIRIFEMLAQFSSTGIFRVYVEDLIRELELPYTRYVDVVRRVIEPAIIELRAKSNMEIEWRPIKEGRAVKTIEFTFRESPQGSLDYFLDADGGT